MIDWKRQRESPKKRTDYHVKPVIVCHVVLLFERVERLIQNKVKIEQKTVTATWKIWSTIHHDNFKLFPRILRVFQNVDNERRAKKKIKKKLNISFIRPDLKPSGMREQAIIY